MISCCFIWSSGLPGSFIWHRGDIQIQVSEVLGCFCAWVYLCVFGYILTRLGMFAMFGCIWMHLGIVEYMLLYLRCLDTFGYTWVPMDTCGYMWCISIYLYIYILICSLCIYTPIYNTHLKRIHVYMCVYIYIYIYIQLPDMYV